MTEQELPLDALNDVYRIIGELTSLETTLILHKHFKGQTVNFPVRLVSQNYVKQLIKEQLTVKGFLTNEEIQKFSIKFNYSERQMRRLVTLARKK